MENKHSNLDEIAQPIVQRQQALELYVLSVIAKRVKAIGELLPSDVYKLSRLAERGADIKKIEKEVARITNLQVSDITQIIKEAATDNYLSLAKNHRLPPLKDNKEIQKIINAVAERTGDTYKNISKAQAFMFRNKKNRKEFVPTSISKTYDEIVDKAIQAVESGAVDYREAMRNSLKELTASGLRNVWYEAESGKLHTQRMDTAVRRNLMDGIREVSQSVMLQTGKQFWSDGVEITVHAYPAPDHAPIQGHMFANEEFNKMQAEQDFKDINGKQYGSIKRSIGIWNCTHFAFPIVIGVDVPTYTQEQLDEILKANQKGYTFPDGKHLTMYECTQEQRRMETEIRYRKEWRKTAEEWGDKQEAERYKAEEKRLTNEYYAFSKACGLRPKYDRLRVEGEVPPKTAKSAIKSSNTDPVKIRSNLIESSAGSVDKSKNGDIINENNVETVETDVHYVGKIDIEKFKLVSSDIKTDDVIITDERIQHIKERHPNDFEQHFKYMQDIVSNPDYIIEANKPKSALLLKSFCEDNKYFKAALRLITSTDDLNFKNSIITFMKIDEKEWKRIIKNKKILYKQE